MWIPGRKGESNQEYALRHVIYNSVYIPPPTWQALEDLLDSRVASKHVPVLEITIDMGN